MDMFRRMGTVKKKFRVQFFIGKLKFSRNLEGKIYVKIKRGDHKQKTEQQLQMSQENKVDFKKEILQFELTLYFDEKENKYQEKAGEIEVIIMNDKGSKIMLGTVPFDVAQYANSGQQSIKEKKKLEETIKKFEGRIQYHVFAKYIGEGSQSSIDKIGNFFFGGGKEKQNEKVAVEEPPQVKKEKKPVKQTQVKTEKHKKKRVKESESDSGSSNRRQNISNSNQMQREEPSENSEEIESKRNVRKPSKNNGVTRNFVQTNGKAYLTSDNEDNEVSQNKMKPFYFDEPHTDLEPERAAKQKAFNKKRANSAQSQEEISNAGNLQKAVDSGKQIKKTLEKPNEQQSLSPTKQNQQNELINTLKGKIQSLEETNERWKEKNHENSEALKKYKNENSELKKQVKELNRKVAEMQKSKVVHGSSTEPNKSGEDEYRDTIVYDPSTEEYRKQIADLERQKNECLVEISKLKAQYKKDFKKYEEVLHSKEENSIEARNENGILIKQQKDEIRTLNEQLGELEAGKKQQQKEARRLKDENRKLVEENSELKGSLSKLKIKLCDRLNEALQKGDDGVISVLMELNKQ